MNLKNFDTLSEFSTKTGKSRQKLTNHITSYTEYLEYMDNMDQAKNVYFLFTSTDSPTSGYSWCSVCTEARQILEERLTERRDCIFMTVHVGSQDEWEDKTNPYRTELNLKALPTLLNLETGKKLEGSYCLKSELLDQILEEECDF